MKNTHSFALHWRAILVGLCTTIMLSGCSGIIGPGPAPQLYVLRPEFTVVAKAPQVGWQLSVAMPTAPLSLDTNRIALQLTPETMDYFANSAWQDRAPVIVQRALLDGFERSGRIRAVARNSEGVRTDYLLQTDVREFEARYDMPDTAPKVIVKISAKLIQTGDRKIAATIRAVHTTQASENSVPAVVKAFDQALGGAVDEIVTWSLVPSHPSPER